MVEVHITLTEGLRCQARHEAGQVFDTDAPKDNGGSGAYFSPTDLVATALGSCMVTTLAIAAQKREIPLAFATASVRKEMGTTPRRHIAALHVALRLPASLEPGARERLERAAHACPVAASLAPTTQVNLVVTYHDAPP